MARVGVVGLGNIGGAVAANLVVDGHDIVVADADATRAAAVEGARPGSVADVAAASEITITSLPTPEVVAEVAEAWAAAAAPGSILLDLSTSSPEGNRALAATLTAGGHHFVEAPLTGGAIGAQKRALVFMVGGDDEPVGRCLPVLEQLGRATFHLGPVGAGTTMKLVNSLLAFTCTWVSLEGLSLAAAAGLDLRTTVEVIRTGGASNFFIDRAVEGIDARGRPPQFALALAAKDARLIEEVAAAAGIPVPVASAVRGVLADALDRGLGERDWSDLVVAAEARAGRPLTLGAEPMGEATRQAQRPVGAAKLSRQPARQDQGGPSAPVPRADPMGEATMAARVPIEEGYFTVPDDPAAAPRLLGSRCGACGEHFFPRRHVCAKCLAEGCDDVELGPRGRLWTWTYVHVPLFAKKDARVDAYGVGQVDLPEGPRVQSIVCGGHDDFAIGMEMELDLESLRTDDEGREVVIFRFRPVAP